VSYVAILAQDFILEKNIQFYTWESISRHGGQLEHLNPRNHVAVGCMVPCVSQAVGYEGKANRTRRQVVLTV